MLNLEANYLHCLLIMSSLYSEFECFMLYRDYSKLRVLVKFLRQVTKTFLVIEPRPELILKLFLNFGKFEPRCSYKVVLIKKNPILWKKG